MSIWENDWFKFYEILSYLILNYIKCIIIYQIIVSVYIKKDTLTSCRNKKGENQKDHMILWFISKFRLNIMVMVRRFK